MKITDLAILFVIITFPFVFLLNLRCDNLELAAYKKMELNRVLDCAVEDGVNDLVNVGGDKRVVISKDRALQSFYNSLFINLDVIGNEIAQRKITGYIPVIAVVDYDGFYILSNDEYADKDGYKIISPMWKEKMPYSKVYENYVISFTLNENVKIYDILTGEYYSDSYKDLKSTISSEIIQNDSLFEEVRRRTIIEALKREINYRINKHNEVARQFGITYNFSLPVINDEDWYNTVDDISMIVFFQGFPIGVGNERYNSYALGGARVVKPIKFYIQTDVSGLEYYHKDGCPKLKTKSIAEESQINCAKKGALPCPVCKP
ncbi:hypothetical protein [Abyssisolibacter fermentans]|uniref:hypothetical protein n=1 Tax=Abyssisolibacter fermentans TaxID=1766203 RepID=UPI000831D74A|nr:hypothetical protein [Abyssisolibacter fermentans]